MVHMNSMPSDAHVSDEWRERVQAYLISQGLGASGPPKNPEASQEIFFMLHGEDDCHTDDIDYLGFYDAVSRIYDESCFNPQLQVNSIALCAAMIETFEPRRVLEAGCTSGIATVFFAKQFPHISFLASDYSSGMIAVTEERIVKTRVSNARTIFAEHAELQIHVVPQSVDMVIADGSVPAPFEIEKFVAFVESVMAPIMMPGGIFISLSLPVSFDVKDLAKELKKTSYKVERDLELIRHGEKRLPPTLLLVLRKGA